MVLLLQSGTSDTRRVRRGWIYDRRFGLMLFISKRARKVRNTFNNIVLQHIQRVNDWPPTKWFKQASARACNAQYNNIIIIYYCGTSPAAARSNKKKKTELIATMMIYYINNDNMYLYGCIIVRVCEILCNVHISEYLYTSSKPQATIWLTLWKNLLYHYTPVSIFN